MNFTGEPHLFRWCVTQTVQPHSFSVNAAGPFMQLQSRIVIGFSKDGNNYTLQYSEWKVVPMELEKP